MDRITVLTKYDKLQGLVVTAYDFESGRPGSNPEWGHYIL